MSDFLSKLINLLKPTVEDLDENLQELSIKSEMLKNIDDMLDEVNDDIKKVPIYHNQQLILDNLDKINTNEREYKACCYLLVNNDEAIRTLPQYVESSNYIERLLAFFKKWREELVLEVSELKIVCEEKEMNKKYLEIFSEENPVVSNISEFRIFLDKQELNNEEKINLLVYTIKNNVSSYIERVKGR